MKEKHTEKQDKRAAALRDNLKRRKAKTKSEKAAIKDERQATDAKTSDK